MSVFRKEVILDFDYTLFDTARFKHALAWALRSLKVPPKLFIATYPPAVHRSNGQYRYSTAVHLRLIKKVVPDLPLVGAQKLLDQVVGESGRYLYPGARKFLIRLRRAGFRLILVTRGAKLFQRRKLKFSGVLRYFARVIISPDLKVSTLAKLAKNFDEVFFISDHAKELNQVHKRFPRLLLIMKLSGHHATRSAALRLGIPAMRSFDVIEKYIVNYHRSTKNGA